MFSPKSDSIIIIFSELFVFNDLNQLIYTQGIKKNFWLEFYQKISKQKKYRANIFQS